jgi:hypothetical protein
MIVTATSSKPRHTEDGKGARIILYGTTAGKTCGECAKFEKEEVLNGMGHFERHTKCTLSKKTAERHWIAGLEACAFFKSKTE